MNQSGSSRMDTVLKMLLIAFISLLAFSSGVYFGKQMSDSDYQLKALESDFSTHAKTADAKGAEVAPEDAIADEEVAAICADPFLAEIAALLPHLEPMHRTLFQGAVRDAAMGRRRTA